MRIPASRSEIRFAVKWHEGWYSHDMFRGQSCGSAFVWHQLLRYYGQLEGAHSWSRRAFCEEKNKIQGLSLWHQNMVKSEKVQQIMEEYER